MSEPPPETPWRGQDDPPDVRTALHAVLRLLHDVLGRVDLEGHDDMRLRLLAMISALARLKRHLDEREGG